MSYTFNMFGGGTDTSDATATANDILSGKTAYVNDKKIEGIIETKTASNLSVSGKTVTVPAGYYASQAIKDVATGSATTPTTTITANPSISIDSAGLITATANATKSVTPTVNAGYVDSGIAGTITISGSNTNQMTTQIATTFNTSTSDQTIAAGTYLTGTQTIKAVTTSNLTAGNIKAGVVVKVGDANSAGRIKNITGTYEGISNSNAILLVTIPSTATSISATLNEITLSPTLWTDNTDSNSKCALFIINPNNFGIYTITVTKNDLVINQTITIDNVKKYELRITFKYYYVKDNAIQTGASFTRLTSTAVVNTSATPVTCYWNANGTITGCYSNAVNLTGYNTLTFQAEHTSSYANNWYIFGFTSNNLNTYDNQTTGLSVYKKLGAKYSKTTYTLDISSLTGNYYFKYYTYDAYGTLKIYNMYLS